MDLLGKAQKPKPMAPSGRWRALGLLSFAELLGMSLWFSASAVVPALSAEWKLNDSTASWLTIAVQLGFVCGTLISAFLNLPDVIDVSYLFAACAFAGALTNAIFGLYASGPNSGIVLRFLTGLFLAGVYPPGMKIMATWFQRSRGMALGVLVGALTVGKATPHALYGLQQLIGNALPWRSVVIAGSVLALIAAALVAFLVTE